MRIKRFSFQQSPGFFISDAMARILIIAIFSQTLFFKFSGAEESRYIFSSIGVEPWGRYLAAFAELGASLLLVFARTVRFGSLASLGIIGGALMTHLFFTGIEVLGDGGLLFGLAVTVFVSSLVLLFIKKSSPYRREQISVFGQPISHRKKP